MTEERVQYEIGGLLRCCAEAVPDRVGAYHGEHIPCPYGHEKDPEGSGVAWSSTRQAWIAAWRLREGHGGE